MSRQLRIRCWDCSAVVLESAERSGLEQVMVLALVKLLACY